MKSLFERPALWLVKRTPPPLECWVHSWFHMQQAFMNGQSSPHVECQCGMTWEFL